MLQQLPLQRTWNNLEPFRITILGCGSAIPTTHHNPSSQIVTIRQKLFMVDCGEGTQLQVRRAKIRFTKVGQVFISHRHGDHCLGFTGMISTFGMLGRTAPLHIYAPKDLIPILKVQQEFFCSEVGYDIVYHHVDTTKNDVIFEDKSLSISTIPLFHRVPCCGYLFKEKPTPRRLEMGIPPKSYAYCSDTRYDPSIASVVKGVTVLYHESTYGDDRAEYAATYMHSTAADAARTALEAGAGKLILGHFSARYEKNEEVLLEQAKNIFPNSVLANEYEVIDV